MAVRPQDLARTLVQRHRERLGQEAGRGELLRRRLRTGAGPLLARAAVRRAWLVGSLATAHFGPGSDVDIVVEGLLPEQRAQLWDELSELLGLDIDLLRLEELPVPFQERVQREGIGLDVA